MQSLICLSKFELSFQYGHHLHGHHLSMHTLYKILIAIRNVHKPGPFTSTSFLQPLSYWSSPWGGVRAMIDGFGMLAATMCSWVHCLESSRSDSLVSLSYISTCKISVDKMAQVILFLTCYCDEVDGIWNFRLTF